MHRVQRKPVENEQLLREQDPKSRLGWDVTFCLHDDYITLLADLMVQHAVQQAGEQCFQIS